MNINYQAINALDLWEVSITPPYPGPSMNLQLKPKANKKIPGFGIYSLSYKHADFGDQIIYLGKYAGEKKGKLLDDALSGDVRERWFKHIGTATLLLAKLKMASSKHFYEHKIRAQKHFSGDPLLMSILNFSLLGLSDEILTESVFIKGADLQISKNRLGFAIQNLRDTNKDQPNTLNELNEIVSRFTCHYWQVTSGAPIKKTAIDKALTGGKNIQGAESEVIERYRHVLPMNHEYSAETESLRGYYHYDPSKLILVGTPQFEEYATFIRKQLLERVALVINQRNI